MNEFTAKHFLFSLPILFVELATLINLFAYYSYLESAVAALLLALSYSVLLVATALLLSQDLSGTIRALIVLGGALLFLVQAASNISEAYLHAQGVLPAATFGALWGTTAAEWYVHSAFIWGGVINVVGLIYWVALGRYYRAEHSRSAAAATRIEELWEHRREAAN